MRAMFACRYGLWPPPFGMLVSRPAWAKASPGMSWRGLRPLQLITSRAPGHRDAVRESGAEQPAFSPWPGGQLDRSIRPGLGQLEGHVREPRSTGRGGAQPGHPVRHLLDLLGVQVLLENRVPEHGPGPRLERDRRDRLRRRLLA